MFIYDAVGPQSGLGDAMPPQGDLERKCLILQNILVDNFNMNLECLLAALRPERNPHIF